MEVTGGCSSRSSSFTLVCLCYTHPPAHPAHPILGSFLHKPVINPHLYTSPWSHDHRMTREEKEFKILGRMIRKPPTSCTGTRLVGNHACWGDLGHQNRVSMKAPRLRGNLLVPERTNQRREREKPCIGWGWPRLQRGRKREGTGVLGVILDPQSLTSGSWSKCPLLS